jgi:hypothetical protein
MASSSYIYEFFVRFTNSGYFWHVFLWLKCNQAFLHDDVPLNTLASFDNHIKELMLIISVFNVLFLVGLGFKLRALTLQSRHFSTKPHHQSIFLWLFGDRFSQTIFPGWPRTTILPISTPQVARTTGMSHWWLAFV